MNSAKLCRLYLITLIYLRQSTVVYKLDKYTVNSYSENWLKLAFLPSIDSNISYYSLGRLALIHPLKYETSIISKDTVHKWKPKVVCHLWSIYYK